MPERGSNRLEVISADCFRSRLAGMTSTDSSCPGVRSRPRRKHHRRTRDLFSSSSGSSGGAKLLPPPPPIRPPQQPVAFDLGKVTTRRDSTSDAESSSSSSSSSSSILSASEVEQAEQETVESKKNDKNLKRFLTAIEKSHIKDDVEGIKNLNEFVQSPKDLRTKVLLNNTHSTAAACTSHRALQFLDAENVELICNDLTNDVTKPRSSSESSEDSEVCSETSSEFSAEVSSETSSDRVSTLSESTSDDLGAVVDDPPDEVDDEELARLARFCEGYALRRYNCPPERCPECLRAYTRHVLGAKSCSAAASAPRKRAVVSVARAETEAVVEPCSEYHCVSIDLTNTDMTYSVQYGTPERGDTHDHPAQRTASCVTSQWSWLQYASAAAWWAGWTGWPWAQPLSTPWDPYPPYPFWPNSMPLAPIVPRPIIVPRDLRCLQSQQLCLVPAPDVGTFTASQPPLRPWIPLSHPERSRPIAVFTVMCYNVLCDKYATRQMYGYCPSWALSWDYRKKGIIEDIRHFGADIISLQEVETDQFYNFFLTELKRDDYDGIFQAKSRARTMSETERKHVDGCAIFWRTSKFQLIKEHLIEFNQLAMSNAEGCDDMLNRVMTKDNIGLTALLETKETIWENGIPPDGQAKQPLLVATCHIHWDPEFSDVKLIQTMMLMSELSNILDESVTSLRPGGGSGDGHIPLLFCGDLNSLPESGVIEFLTSGRVAADHRDFKAKSYKHILSKMFSQSDSKEYYSHAFKLGAAYSKDVMPYTNYTFDFKGIIDYIFYTRDSMRPLGLLGPLDPDWFKDNKVLGCPHPHVPSDHLPLLVELEMVPSAQARAQTLTHERPGGHHQSSRQFARRYDVTHRSELTPFAAGS